jgi:hypothetical protein
LAKRSHNDLHTWNLRTCGGHWKAWVHFILLYCFFKRGKPLIFFLW